ALKICVFFFSSRRRHTIFSRDWSSDVCSSDLGIVEHRKRPEQHPGRRVVRLRRALSVREEAKMIPDALKLDARVVLPACLVPAQIGRASCRALEIITSTTTPSYV